MGKKISSEMADKLAEKIKEKLSAKKSDDKINLTDLVKELADRREQNLEEESDN